MTSITLVPEKKKLDNNLPSASRQFHAADGNTNYLHPLDLKICSTSFDLKNASQRFCILISSIGKVVVGVSVIALKSHSLGEWKSLSELKIPRPSFDSQLLTGRHFAQSCYPRPAC